MPTCNGHDVEPGCYVSGSWGQYRPDHLADRAAEFGWEPAKWSEDPRVIRDVIDTIETWGYPRQPADFATSEAVAIIGFLWEAHTEAADDIETWLNDRTPPEQYRVLREEPCECHDPPIIHGLDVRERQFYWMWSDGEFYLAQIDDEGEPTWD